MIVFVFVDASVDGAVRQLKTDAAMADDKPFECTQPGCGMVCTLWFLTFSNN